MRLVIGHGVVTTLWIAACSTSPNSGPDASTAREPATPGDAMMPVQVDAAPLIIDGAVDDAQDDAGGEPEPSESVPYCQLQCLTNTDCVTPSPAFDGDNYVCDEGLCRYTGCNDDLECQRTFMRGDYACRAVVGDTPVCTQTCLSVASCGTGTPAFDQDNYVCEDQVCRYVGCQDDQECQVTFSNLNYVCREMEAYDLGIPVPSAQRNCVLGCVTAVDCQTGSAAFDSDNFTCEDQVCIYGGCNDDGECQSSFWSTSYVCR